MGATVSCLTINGCVGVYTGWAQHLSQIASRLSETATVWVRPIRYCSNYGEIPLWLDTITSYEIPECPNELIVYTTSQEPTPRKRTAYFTMHETDRMPPIGVSHMNRSEVVIVPNHWNKKTFESSGVKAPIKVVPLGVDSNIFRYQPMKMDGPTIFGCAGRPQHGVIRKGVNLVIQAFQKAFTANDNVLLWMKSLPDEGGWHVPDEAVNIVVTPKYMDDEELGEWFGGITCFVSAATGEGWGLMQHQAMACGRPVVASIYGGLAEFMTNENSYACDYDVGPAAEKYAGWGNWANPRLEHLIDLMRYVHQSRDEAARRGRKAAEDVKHLTWDSSCHQLFTVLKDHQFL